VNRIAATVGLVLVGLSSCGRVGQPRQALPVVYVIESGKTGWVKVIYNRSDEKELPVENGFVVARVGQDLKLFTRSRMNPSWDGSMFYYRMPDGKRVPLSREDNASRRIWAQEKTTDADGEREVFFVGDQRELSRDFGATGSLGSGLSGPGQNAQTSTEPDDQIDPNKILTALPK
jgi:hypothetical protein